MRSLVIGNDGDADPGYIGARAEFHGYHLTVVTREATDQWPSLDEVDLVISLGSEWSVYWDHVQASVQPEVALLREASYRDIPVFGICFGSQLLASAHGGTVSRSATPEIGWFEVEATEAGRGFIDDGPWFQWHDDHWTLPSGATLLAANDNANQAFVLGRSVATQFHPELTENILEHWLKLGGEAIAIERGLDPEVMVKQTVSTAAAAERRAATLFDRFLALVTR